MASNLAYLDANRAHREYILVEFTPEIRWHGREYAGLTTETMARVRWHGDCILGPNSALIHELVHVALYLQEGDPDAEHKHHDWALIDGLHVPCRLP